MNQANIQIMNNNYAGGVATSLWQYFEGDFIREVTERYEVKIPTGLSNLDFVLNGGISSELYTVIGKIGDERSAFFSYLAEQFALNGYAGLYISHNDTANSILQKIVARHDYKLYRDKSPHITTIINKLSSSPHLLQEYQSNLYPILTKIYVENCRYLDTELMVERITAYKKTNQKVVVLIDEKVPSFYQSDVDRIGYQQHLRTINKIAREYETPILMNVTLTKGDFERITAGFSTAAEIEANVDNLILFSKHSSADNELQSTINPYLMELIIRSNLSPYPTQIAHLIYHPNYFYFQDA